MRRLFRVSGLLLVLTIAASLVVLLLSPAPVGASPLTPASPQARLQADLFWVTLGIALVILVVVEFLLIYTSLRFRKRAGGPEIEPPQIHGNTRLEVMWSILPAVILVSLFVISVRTMANLGSAPPNARHIQVVGRQFSWEFTYPDAQVKTTNDLRLPVGEPVVLDVTSQDVIHSFWVPDLGGKIDAIPGITNHNTFTPERTGTFRGVCAELCGAGHANMLFTVTVMEKGEFESWLQEGAAAAAQQQVQLAAGPNPDVGKRLLVEKGCGACHTIAGVAGMEGKVGPELTHVATNAAGRKPGMDAEAYLRESIQEPAAFTVPGFPAGVMPKLPMSDQELASIVAYLMTLK